MTIVASAAERDREADGAASTTDPLDAPFRRLRAGATDGTVFRCGLCGAAFTHGGQVCGACPLNAGCDLVKCPSCGYQFPRTSRLVEWGRRLWRRVGRREA